MEELFNIKRTLRKERAEQGLGAGLTKGKFHGAQGVAQRTCGLYVLLLAQRMRC